MGIISLLLVYVSEIFISWCAYYSMIVLDDDRHKNIKKYIIFSLIIWITLNITKSINDLFITFILNALMFYIIYCLNKPNSMVKGLAVVLVLYMFIIIGEVFVATVFMTIFKSNYINLIKNSYIKTISNVIVGSILLLLSKLKVMNMEITKSFERIVYNKNLKNFSFYGLLVIFGVSITYMYYLTKNSNFFGFLIIVLFILISSICLMEMKRKATYKEFYEEYVYKYDELKTYTALNENLICELRKQKHDNKNALIVLKGMIRENKNSKYEEMLDKMIGDNVSIKNEDINRFMYIKETGLKYLFLHKYLVAKNVNLHVNVDIQKNMVDVDLDRYQHSFLKSLYTIIGIIFDNAIEDASDSKDQSIAIQIGYMNSNINIFVINTYDDEPDMSQIKNRGYSTKGTGRGYGLTILSEISEYYSDILSVNTYLHNGLFTQQIIIVYNK